MGTQIAILILLLLSSCCGAISQQETPSAYEMLEKYNFPKGILPTGVQSYNLNQDGSFEVFLNGDCEFRVDEGGYLLKYKKKISGVVKSGSLRELRGVSVKVLLMWFGISEVERSNEELNFYVGPLSASFSVKNFEESPECPCGFNCSTPLISDS